MCLDRLVTFEVTKGYGWQVFRKKETGLVQLYRHHFQRHPTIVVAGAWQTDPSTYYIRPSYGFDRYKTGFHIILGFEDALGYLDHIEFDERIIRKVWFKDVVATGEEFFSRYPARSAKVVVARKRYVERA